MASTTPSVTTRRPSSLLILVLIVAAYTALVVARRALLIPNAEAAIWPAAGVMAAGFLLIDRRHYLWLMAASVVCNIVLNTVFGFSSRTLLSIPEAGLLALLTFLAVGRNMNFCDGRKLGAFVLLAVIPTCMLSAAMLLILPTGQGPPATLINSGRWFFAHALGAAVALPCVVTLFHTRRFASFRRSPLETLIACALVVAFVEAVLWGQIRTSILFVFPMAMFIAFRYGPVGAALLTLSLTALALVFIYVGMPAHDAGGRYNTQWVQLFVAALFLTMLPAAGALASLKRMRLLLSKRTQTARRARTRADAAAHAKSEFLANMSHEIRTPLNGVIGLADALSHTELQPRQREMLGMILTSGRALNGLLSDALDLARADSGALRLHAEAFDLRESISAATYLFETLARDKGVAFSVEFDLRHGGAAVGDALRIRQIVSNLTSNAVKFTERGAIRVEVSLVPIDAGHGRLLVAVHDTGPGFDEVVKARLFSRFEQGDGSVTRKFGGTGLGLSISQKLAAMMDGVIGCDSTPGEGSTFTFGMTLPLQEQAIAPATVVDDEPQQAGAWSRPRVLLAEDHPVNQKVIEALLGDSVELTIVADGQAALDALEGQAFDLVLMDTQMPRMDGLTATRALRAREAGSRGRRTPVVSLTADAMPQQVRAAFAAGADLHLAKPVTAETLFATLGQAMELAEAAPSSAQAPPSAA